MDPMREMRFFNKPLCLNSWRTDHNDHPINLGRQVALVVMSFFQTSGSPLAGHWVVILLEGSSSKTRGGERASRRRRNWQPRGPLVGRC